MRTARELKLSRHQGMALVLVLWIVAALSVFAMGLGTVLRQEAALVNVSRNMAYGRAAGEAVIFEALQRMSVQSNLTDKLVTLDTVFMERNVQLQIIPWSGLININAAPAPLLAMLLQNAAQLPPAEAASLARTVIEARTSIAAASGGQVPWDAPEDLLQVSGMGYAIFTRIREYLVAEPGGRQGINPEAALPSLKAWLESSSPPSQQSSAGTRYTLVANVLFEGQGTVRVMRQVSMSSSETGKLPWKLHAATQTWAGLL